MGEGGAVEGMGDAAGTEAGLERAAGAAGEAEVAGAAREAHNDPRTTAAELPDSQAVPVGGAEEGVNEAVDEAAAANDWVAEYSDESDDLASTAQRRAEAAAEAELERQAGGGQPYIPHYLPVCPLPLTRLPLRVTPGCGARSRGPSGGRGEDFGSGREECRG